MTETGHVITSLMHVADVLAVCKANGPSTCLSGTDSQTGLHELAATYVKRPEAAAVGLKPPSVVSVPVVSLQLKTLADEHAAQDPDNELLLLDGAPDVQRKMKKAFCEPQNLEHCPPLTVSVEAVLPSPKGQEADHQTAGRQWRRRRVYRRGSVEEELRVGRAPSGRFEARRARRFG